MIGIGERLRKKRGAYGFTLVEILVSMAVVSILVVMLGETLNQTLDTWSGGRQHSETYGEARAALNMVKGDLSSAFTNRPANVPPLPASVQGAQRAFFSDRLFMPIEINRRNGTGGQDRSFVNGDDEFDSLAFVTIAPLSRQVHTLYDRASEEILDEWAGGNPEEAPRAYDRDTISVADTCFAGYYVAYTMDSPLPTSGASMKLYRHFRRPGNISSTGQSRARNFILYQSHVINDANDEGPRRSRAEGAANPALVRKGEFRNGQVPFLFSEYITNERTFESEKGMAPWPSNPVMRGGPDLAEPPSPFPPPDRSDPAAWADKEHPMHDYVYPDEPVARGVVRFECKPYRRVETGSGGVEVMDAKDLNAHLGLGGGDEWPVLVAPDFIDIKLGVIDSETAAKLPEQEDWYFDWDQTDSASWDWRRRLVEQNMRIFDLRVYVRQRP
ncbi:MAG: type II secretion system protein [Verrucomicrobiota bacterium]